MLQVLSSRMHQSEGTPPAPVSVGQPSVSFGAEGGVMDMTEARWAVFAAPRRQYGTCRVETGDFSRDSAQCTANECTRQLTGIFPRIAQPTNVPTLRTTTRSGLSTNPHDLTAPARAAALLHAIGTVQQIISASCNEDASFSCCAIYEMASRRRTRLVRNGVCRVAATPPSPGAHARAHCGRRSAPHPRGSRPAPGAGRPRNWTRPGRPRRAVL